MRRRAAVAAVALLCAVLGDDVAICQADSLQAVEELIAALRLGEAEGQLARLLEAQIAGAGQRPGEPRAWAPVLHALILAEHIQGSGRFRLREKTLDLVSRARALQEAALGDHLQVARGYFVCGSINVHAGDYSAARASFRRSLEMRQKLGATGGAEFADALIFYAALLERLGSREEAFSIYQRALETVEEAPEPLLAWRAKILNNMGSVLARQGDIEQAHRYQERSLEIFQQLPANASVIHAVSVLRNNLGRNHLDLGRADLALPLLEQSLAEGRKVLGGRHAGIAVTLRNLARTNSRLGEPVKALETFEQALAMQRAILHADDPQIAETLGFFAGFLDRQGHPERAFGMALEAEDLRRGHVRRTIRHLGEQQALDYAALASPGLDLAVSLAARDAGAETHRRAWDAVIRSRALVLDEMAGRSKELALATSPELTALVEELAAARQQLADLSVRSAGPDAGSQQQLLRARQRLQKAGEDLASASSLYRAQVESGQVGFEQVAAALPPSGGLVAFTLGHDGPEAGLLTAEHRRYRAFILRGDSSDPEIVDLGEAARLDRLVEGWHDQISRHSVKRYRRAGDKLRQAIWDPVVGQLGDAATVFVVPDGLLHLVSFQALPAMDGGYLVEQAPVIHTLSAERDLVPGARPAGAPASPGLLAVGGVSFDLAAAASPSAEPGPPPERGAPASGGCEQLPQARFEPLVATGHEARQVVAAFKAGGDGGGEVTTLLSGPGATEEAVKTLAPRHQVLHFATHGFFVDPASCAAGDGPPVARQQSSMHRSGLALAGANHRLEAAAGDEDGILTAAEIAALDLRGVRLAVLSACDSGLGDVVAGEGVVGLQRAFRVAGASTLVMSLWRVDDESTRRFMTELYQARFAGRQPPALAVRTASRRILEHRRRLGRSTHPYYWGAFIAVGAADGELKPRG